jgi:hypothetical protein
MAPIVRLGAAVMALLTWPTLARDVARGVAVDNDAVDNDDAPDDADVMDAPTAPVAAAQTTRHHHKHRHHHHKKHHHKEHDADKVPAKAAASKDGPSAVVISNVKRVAAAGSADEHSLVAKLKDMGAKLAAKEKVDGEKRTSIKVNGPLPEDFNARFAEAVALATKCKVSEVKVIGALPDVDGVVQVIFEAPNRIADETVDEAADADSALATGPLMNFLIEKGPEEATKEETKEIAKEESVNDEAAHGTRIDVDASMPYGDLEPFGREDTAQELTEAAVTESNEMVDQLERAEVAEEKRAVFRALTRLRGAAVTSFDGIARAQTGNIDEYNKVNKWRKTHPLHHLAQEESDVSRWAFPNNAD